jgi:hypothetical protein
MSVDQLLLEEVQGLLKEAGFLDSAARFGGRALSGLGRMTGLTGGPGVRPLLAMRRQVPLVMPEMRAGQAATQAARLPEEMTTIPWGVRVLGGEARPWARQQAVRETLAPAPTIHGHYQPGGQFAVVSQPLQLNQEALQRMHEVRRHELYHAYNDMTRRAPQMGLVHSSVPAGQTQASQQLYANAPWPTRASAWLQNRPTGFLRGLGAVSNEMMARTAERGNPLHAFELFKPRVASSYAPYMTQEGGPWFNRAFQALPYAAAVGGTNLATTGAVLGGHHLYQSLSDGQPTPTQ